MKRAIFLILYLFFGILAYSQNSLENFLQSAEKNSPLINSYQNKIAITKLDSVKMKADYGFRVAGLGDASYSPVVNGWGYNGSPSNGRNLSAIVKATKDFLGKKNMDTRLETFNIAVAQLQNQKKLDQLTLKRLISEQYLYTYSNQEEYAILKEILHLFEQEDLILKKLTQASVFKQTDYLNFKVNYQQNLLALEQKKNEWNSNYNMLNYLAGIRDTKIRTLAKPAIHHTASTDYSESIYTETYKTDSIKLENERALINLDYRPKISAYADTGYSSSLTQTPYKNFGFSTGLSLTIPIFDGHKKKMLYEQNRLTADIQKQYYRYGATQYAQRQAMLENQISNYNAMISLSHKQINYAKTLIEANLKQLPTGDVKVVDFILSINNYLNLKIGIVQNELQRNLAINNLQNLIIQ